MLNDTTNFVAKMSECLEPTIRITDHTGKTYAFRKYHWMSSTGITDENGERVLLKALPAYKTIKIFDTYEAIVAGSKAYGWEIFSLDLQKLTETPISSIDEVYLKMKKRKRNLYKNDRV